MGTVRSPFKAEAIKMRLEGRSYGYIVKRLGLTSKGTLSYWFKGLILSPKAQLLLQENNELATKRNLHKFNNDRTRLIQGENNSECALGKGNIGSLSQRELLLVGSALYWGEGTKSQGVGRSPILAFTNSDPLMHVLYLKFARKILNVPDIQIRGGIHLYPNTNVQEARDYWSNITKLPSDRFYIVMMVSGASAGKRNPRLLPHGTLTLRINKRKLFHFVKGMIQGLSQAPITD